LFVDCLLRLLLLLLLLLLFLTTAQCRYSTRIAQAKKNRTDLYREICINCLEVTITVNSDDDHR
jgi:hypothetical protein